MLKNGLSLFGRTSDAVGSQIDFRDWCTMSSAVTSHFHNHTTANQFLGNCTAFPPSFYDAPYFYWKKPKELLLTKRNKEK